MFFLYKKEKIKKYTKILCAQILKSIILIFRTDNRKPYELLLCHVLKKTKSYIFFCRLFEAKFLPCCSFLCNRNILHQQRVTFRASLKFIKYIGLLTILVYVVVLFNTQTNCLYIFFRKIFICEENFSKTNFYDSFFFNNLLVEG